MASTFYTDGYREGLRGDPRSPPGTYERTEHGQLHGLPVLDREYLNGYRRGEAVRLGKPRSIGLPNGKSISFTAFCSSWRQAKEIAKTHPEALIKGWEWYPVKVDEVLREIRFGMHDRINRHVPGYGKGRKWAREWQLEARRTSNAVNTPRLIVRWVPKDLWARLSHRITVEG